MQTERIKEVTNGIRRLQLLKIQSNTPQKQGKLHHIGNDVTNVTSIRIPQLLVTGRQ